jgi:hypothetical protein
MSDYDTFLYKKLYKIRGNDHYSINNLKKILGPIVKNYKMIISIRNPWDRFISLFYYLKQLPDDVKLSTIVNPDSFFSLIDELKDGLDFNGYSNRVFKNEEIKNLISSYNLENMIGDNKCEIIKLETIQEDLKKLGYYFSNIPIKNNSKRLAFNSLSKEANDFITEIFSSDIKAGNYKNPY